MTDATDWSRPSDRLANSVGTWDVDCTYFMEGQQPMKARARDTIRPIGGLWTTSDFRTEMMGVPFEGQATVGYQPADGTWVATWADSMTPHLFYFRGEGGGGSVVEMTARAPSPLTGEATRFRTREEIVDADHRVFEMFMQLADGGEVQMFRYEYARA